MCQAVMCCASRRQDLQVGEGGKPFCVVGPSAGLVLCSPPHQLDPAQVAVCSRAALNEAVSDAEARTHQK